MGACVLVLTFAFGWTPCIGPILVAILTLSANSGSLSGGVWLLEIHSLGRGLTFLLIAPFTGAISAPIKTFRQALYPLAGGVMIMMGLAMIPGQMTPMACWLLETFPGLASRGP